MTTNTIYTLEDLLLNASFFNFYCKKNENDALDWEEWCEDNPERTALVAEAFGVLDRLTLKWDKATIDEQYAQIRTELLSEKTMTIEKPMQIVSLFWRYAAAARGGASPRHTPLPSPAKGRSAEQPS